MRVGLVGGERGIGESEGEFGEGGEEGAGGLPEDGGGV